MTSPLSANEQASITLKSSVLEGDKQDFLKSYRVLGDTVGTHLDGAIGADSKIFSLNFGTSTLHQQLRTSNVADGDLVKLVRMINGGEGHALVKTRRCGKMVPEECIRLIETNGSISAVGPGRWRTRFTKGSRWVSDSVLWCGTSAFIPVFRQGPLTICRVRPNEIGLAFEHDSMPVLLAPGLHVYNTPSFRFHRTVDVQENYIQHGLFHILQVPLGSHALVWESPTQPRVLSQGQHVVASMTFKFDKFIAMKDTYCKHGTIHIIQVPKCHVAKVVQNAVPKLLHEGLHAVDHPNLEFNGLELLSSPIIRHESLTRFRVDEGDVGLATWKHEAVLVEAPGTYEIDSFDFIYHETISASSELAQNSRKRLVEVEDAILEQEHKAHMSQAPSKQEACASQVGTESQSIVAKKRKLNRPMIPLPLRHWIRC